MIRFMLGMVVFAACLAAAGTATATQPLLVTGAGATSVRDHIVVHARATGPLSAEPEPVALAEGFVRWREAWCQWQGKEIVVNVRLTNQFGARVRVSVTPKYKIENGGWHGNSFGSDQDVTIDPEGEASLRISAGHPEGVPHGAPISKCEPTLDSIDVTD